MMRDRLGATPVPIQLPWGAEDDFRGVIDLVQMKAHRLRRREPGRRASSTSRSPPSIAERAQAVREQMVEAVAETDDELLEKYLAGDEIDER